MQALRIQDLAPESQTFTLRVTGEKKYRLRPMSIADAEWMAETWGQEKLNEIFAQLRTKELCRIIFRLLDEESQAAFARQKVTITNEETGDKVEQEFGGVPLMLRMIAGIDEFAGIVQCLRKVIGVSDRYLEVVEEEEKKRAQILAEIQAKRETTSQTGAPSST
jgi:hypothetical protein